MSECRPGCSRNTTSGGSTRRSCATSPAKTRRATTRRCFSPSRSRGSPRADEPLPLAVLAGPCGVRAAALRALERAGVRWRERFTGGGVAAVAAAAAAGLAVCPLARRVAPRSLVDVGARLRLPALPDSQVALYSRVRDARSIDTLRRFADSLAGPAQSAGRE
ncbi:LysR family transcriptional regulator [Burkholderia pseudomallei]|nr:lysR substrate binding domain protein [Burkholderia pseudomallei MSHR3335]VBC19791.1 LysR family transcriptional regulator [Burkholderia pseudomallei]VBN81943.1 LysR family transcriptional regulator [Burkholderia pseudomallei]VCG26897.1 LysR family transcriptional regulator [Burkholderia pseudomallei]